MVKRPPRPKTLYPDCNVLKRWFLEKATGPWLSPSLRLKVVLRASLQYVKFTWQANCPAEMGP